MIYQITYPGRYIIIEIRIILISFLQTWVKIFICSHHFTTQYCSNSISFVVMEVIKLFHFSYFATNFLIHLRTSILATLPYKVLCRSSIFGRGPRIPPPDTRPYTVVVPSLVNVNGPWNWQIIRWEKSNRSNQCYNNFMYIYDY